MPARLQPAQRQGALDVVARGGPRHRRHRRGVRRDAGARARLPGDAGLVGPAAERHRAAGGRRLRDDERASRLDAVRIGRGSRRRSRVAGPTPLVSAEVVVIAALPLRGTTPMPTSRCAASRRGCSRCATTCARQGRFFTPGLYEIVVGKHAIARVRGPRPRARQSASGRGRGRSWASSTPAAAPSTRKSGPTPTSSTATTSGRTASSNR